MLRLAQGQGSAILQTPQALGGSAQQAPAAQGGVGVLTPPGQGGAVVSGQQTQSGPAALQPQQGKTVQQAQVSRRIQLPETVWDGFQLWRSKKNTVALPWLENELMLWQNGSSDTSLDVDLMAKLPNRAIEKFDPVRYNNIINEFAKINSQTIYQEAVAGKKHKGPYEQAMTRKKNRLEKSIHNHTEQVLEHMLKIENPLSGANNWSALMIEEKKGCIVKWIKDMVRNAEQALIEIEIWRNRYEHSDDEN